MRRHLANQLHEVANIRALVAMRAQSNAARAARELMNQEVVCEEAKRHLDECHHGWQSAISDPHRMTGIAAAWAQTLTHQAQTVTLAQARLIEAQADSERKMQGWHVAQLLRDDSQKRSRFAARQIARLKDDAALSEISERHVKVGESA